MNAPWEVTQEQVNLTLNVMQKVDPSIHKWPAEVLTKALTDEGGYLEGFNLVEVLQFVKAWQFDF